MLQMALQRLKQLAAHEWDTHSDSCIIIFQAHKIEPVSWIIPTNGNLNSNNEIDLSSAYTNEIGVGTSKYQYGYEQFPKDKYRP
jgi:hypothetical protein